MTALVTLVRLRRHRLDERRRQIVELERLAAELAAERDRLVATLSAEAAVAEAAPTGFAFPAFAGAGIARRRNIDRSLAEIEARLLRARDVLAEEFRSLKALEQAAEARQLRDRDRRRRREQAELDAVALSLHRRAAPPGPGDPTGS